MRRYESDATRWLDELKKKREETDRLNERIRIQIADQARKDALEEIRKRNLEYDKRQAELKKK